MATTTVTTTATTASERDIKRAAHLRDAQNKAVDLFRVVEQTLVRPGVSEKALSEEIYKLGQERYGIKKYWHKRIVRSGPNTLAPYAANPPDRIIQEDDLLIVDLGPVFEAWEADFARTFVLGNDPEKASLVADLEPVWEAVQARFLQDTQMSGGQLYAIAAEEAAKRGRTFGAPFAGHLIGNFPHERIPKDMVNLYITDGNKEPMNSLGADGQRRHWILEIYLHEHAKNFGGFFEQLLTDDERYLQAPAAKAASAQAPSRARLLPIGVFLALLVALLGWLYSQQQWGQ